MKKLMPYPKRKQRTKFLLISSVFYILEIVFIVAISSGDTLAVLLGVMGGGLTILSGYQIPLLLDRHNDIKMSRELRTKAKAIVRRYPNNNYVKQFDEELGNEKQIFDSASSFLTLITFVILVSTLLIAILIASESPATYYLSFILLLLIMIIFYSLAKRGLKKLKRLRNILIEGIDNSHKNTNFLKVVEKYYRQ